MRCNENYDNENFGTALGSEAVDTQFWALICDDEEWLRTEFDGIVSAPAETPIGPPPRRSPAVDWGRPDGPGRRAARAGPARRCVTQPSPGRYRGNQRSPPTGATGAAVRNDHHEDHTENDNR